MSSHLVNPELMAAAYIKLAQAQAAEKSAFVPGGDPAGGAGGPPPGDPSAGGGMPMDPSMMAPPMAGAGGPPPMDPAMQPPPPPAAAPSPAMQSVEPIKPKIDVNVTMLQILKILAKIADVLGVQIPASEMVATQGDLTQFGMTQQGPPAGGGPAGSAPTGSAISPIEPMPAAAPGGKTASVGVAFDGAGLSTLSDRAAAIAAIRRQQAN